MDSNGAQPNAHRRQMRCKNLHPIDEKVPNLGQAHLSLDQTLKTWRIFRDEDRLTAFTSCYVRFLHIKQVHGGMARSQQASPGVTRRHQASPGVTRRFMGHVLACLRLPAYRWTGRTIGRTSHGNRLNQAAKLQHGHMTWVTPRLIGIPLAAMKAWPHGYGMGAMAHFWSILQHTMKYCNFLTVLTP